MYKEVNGNKYILVKNITDKKFYKGQLVSANEVRIVKNLGIVKYYIVLGFWKVVPKLKMLLKWLID